MAYEPSHAVDHPPVGAGTEYVATTEPAVPAVADTSVACWLYPLLGPFTMRSPLPIVAALIPDASDQVMVKEVGLLSAVVTPAGGVNVNEGAVVSPLPM